MSYAEYHADLKGHVRDRDDALLELEAAGDDEKSVDAAIEKIKAYSMLIARRKEAIATLPSPAPRPPCGTLNLGKWAYVFDPDNGNRWTNTNKVAPGGPLSKFDAKNTQFARGTGAINVLEKHLRYAADAIELLACGKFYSVGGMDDGENNIADIALLDHQCEKMRVIAQHPRMDIVCIAAAAIGSIIYISCDYYNKEEEDYAEDDMIRTLNISRDPPVWGEISIPAPIDVMFRSGDCIITAGYAPKALGIICAGAWTPLPDPFPGKKITKIEWFDHVPNP